MGFWGIADIVFRLKILLMISKIFPFDSDNVFSNTSFEVHFEEISIILPFKMAEVTVNDFNGLFWLSIASRIEDGSLSLKMTILLFMIETNTNFFSNSKVEKPFGYNRSVSTAN